MINVEAARKIATAHVRGLGNEAKLELTLVEEPIASDHYGWVFGYNTTAYLETNSFSFALAGNAPLLVEKSTGILRSLGTAYPVEYYINNYIEFGDPHAEASRQIELFSHDDQNIRPIEAIKLIRSECGIGLEKARIAFEDCVSDGSPILELENPDAAQQMVISLKTCGILAKRLPK